MSSRPINVRAFKKEITLVREIYNSAWEKNWGFVPWTKEEMTDLAKNLKPLIVPELVQIGFFKDEPIGFLLALPDYNEIIKKIGRKLFPFGFIKFIMLKKKIKNLRVLALGVKKEYQNKGIGALMYYNSIREAMKKNYKECESSWILEENKETLKIAKMFGGKIYKKYRVYEKNLHKL